MRYALSLLDKLLHRSPGATPGQVLPGLSLGELKDSVAADLEALLNTRSGLAADVAQRFPLSAGSVANYGVPDFASKSLASGPDRDFICRAIQRAIEHQDPRLREVVVSLADGPPAFNRLDFTIRAVLRVAEAAEPVSFDARLEPTLQRYRVARQRRDGLA
jgi:type VI secretion system protein ImpF